MRSFQDGGLFPSVVWSVGGPQVKEVFANDIIGDFLCSSWDPYCRVPGAVSSLIANC